MCTALFSGGVLVCMRTEERCCLVCMGMCHGQSLYRVNTMHGQITCSNYDNDFLRTKERSMLFSVYANVNAFVIVALSSLYRFTIICALPPRRPQTGTKRLK